ncbi:MAG TPA: hypothetical protein VF303_02095 [Candidatus Nanoarchaeia archaeon]
MKDENHLEKTKDWIVSLDPGAHEKIANLVKKLKVQHDLEGGKYFHIPDSSSETKAILDNLNYKNFVSLHQTRYWKDGIVEIVDPPITVDEIEIENKGVWENVLVSLNNPHFDYLHSLLQQEPNRRSPSGNQLVNLPSSGDLLGKIPDNKKNKVPKSMAKLLFTEGTEGVVPDFDLARCLERSLTRRELSRNHKEYAEKILNRLKTVKKYWNRYFQIKRVRLPIEGYGIRPRQGS